MSNVAPEIGAMVAATGEPCRAGGARHAGGNTLTCRANPAFRAFRIGETRRAIMARQTFPAGARRIVLASRNARELRPAIFSCRTEVTGTRRALDADVVGRANAGRAVRVRFAPLSANERIADLAVRAVVGRPAEARDAEVRCRIASRGRSRATGVVGAPANIFFAAATGVGRYDPGIRLAGARRVAGADIRLFGGGACCEPWHQHNRNPADQLSPARCSPALPRQALRLHIALSGTPLCERMCPFYGNFPFSTSRDKSWQVGAAVFANQPTRRELGVMDRGCPRESHPG